MGLFSYLAKFDSQSAAKLFLTVVKSSLQPNSDGNVKWFPQVQALSLAFIGSKIGQYSSDLWIFICREKFLSTLSEFPIPVRN